MTKSLLATHLRDANFLVKQTCSFIWTGAFSDSLRLMIHDEIEFKDTLNPNDGRLARPQRRPGAVHPASARGYAGGSAGQKPQRTA